MQDFSKETITEFIPQRPPFVMVDHIVAHSEMGLTTQFEILEKNHLVENGLFTESGLLENIAQTAASKVGLECKMKQIEVPIGFIGGINKVAVNKLPKVGDVIKTEIEILQEVFNITLISGKSFVGDDQLIECQMKIVLNP